MDHTIIPMEITEWTDLIGFDEYEAHAAGWSQELIRAAIYEIQRRELEPNTPTISEAISCQRTIHIDAPGDPSVGINPDYAKVEMTIWDDDYRKIVREVLEDAFAQIFDGGCVLVTFDDELEED